MRLVMLPARVSARARLGQPEVGAIADRQLRRVDAVGGQPAIDHLDYLHDRARLPLGAHPDFAAAAVERDRRAAKQFREPSHQAVRAGRVGDRDTDLHHQVLRFEASSPTESLRPARY